MIQFELRGLDELIAKFKERPILVSRQITNILNKAGDDFEEKAWNRAPRGETGHLKDSVYSKVDADNLTLEIGSDSAIAYYNIYVEYGTRFMDARPFFRNTRDEILRYINTELRKL